MRKVRLRVNIMQEKIKIYVSAKIEMEVLIMSKILVRAILIIKIWITVIKIRLLIVVKLKLCRIKNMKFAIFW